MAQKTAKQEIRELLKELPDHYTKAQIAHEIYVQEQIDKSLADSRPSLSVEEALKDIKEWREAGRL